MPPSADFGETRRDVPVQRRAAAASRGGNTVIADGDVARTLPITEHLP
jgi:hypothetical protein